MLSEKAANEARGRKPQKNGTFGLLNVVTETAGDGTVTVELEGELDVYSAGDLYNQLREAEAGARDMVVDLSGLEFIDCAGLHQLVEACHRAEARGGRLTLVKGPQNVQRVFMLTGKECDFEFLPGLTGA